MATDPAEHPKHPASNEDFVPSPLSGTRAQSVQRLQVGLFGIGSMVLLVGLANVVLTNARQNEAQVVPEAAPTVAAPEEVKPPSDPLAEAGIVPELPAQNQPVLVTPPPPPEPGDAVPPQP
jgi:hypothetical protein